MALKEYSNGEITIVWNASLCKHSGNCVKGAPLVFKPKEKPWVKAEAATSKHIMKTIDTCPSGALTYYKNNS